jgi:formate hydrogenlyase subunit 3/multisubunit Na+/H+ antiporter MnhD subunit
MFSLFIVGLIVVMAYARVCVLAFQNKTQNGKKDVPQKVSAIEITLLLLLV